MKEIPLKFYCSCKRSCEKCPKPEKGRYQCIIPRSEDCWQMSSPQVCPCLRAVRVEKNG